MFPVDISPAKRNLTTLVSPGNTQTVLTVVPDKNQAYLGRQKELDTIHSAYSSGAAYVLVLHGLGG